MFVLFYCLLKVLLSPFFNSVHALIKKCLIATKCQPSSKPSVRCNLFAGGGSCFSVGGCCLIRVVIPGRVGWLWRFLKVRHQWNLLHQLTLPFPWTLRGHCRVINWPNFNIVVSGNMQTWGEGGEQPVGRAVRTHTTFIDQVHHLICVWFMMP